MNALIKALRENWAKYLIEALVITFSIIGAFMLDNWNDERKERIEESAYLQRYHNNLVQDTAYLRSKIIEALMAKDSTMLFISLMPHLSRYFNYDALNEYNFDMSEVYYNMLLSKAKSLLKLIEGQ